MSFIIGMFIAILALFARMHLRNWFAPGAFFALMWSFFILLSLILAPSYPVSAVAVLYILMSVLAVYYGGLVGCGIYPNFRSIPSTHLYLPLIKHVICIFIFLGFCYDIATIYLVGYRTSVFLSIDELASMGNEISVARYSGYDIAPFWLQLLLPFLYVSPLVGGLLFISETSRLARLLSLLSLAPGLLSTVIRTTLANILFASAFWVASYLAGYVFLKKSKARLFTKGRLLTILLLTLLGIPAMIIIHLLRIGLAPTDILQELLRVRAYLFGSLSGFSQVFQMFQFVHKLPEGLYFDLDGGLVTNITTLFFFLIQDFNFLGSILILFAIGICAGWAYYQVLRGQKNYIPILVTFYALTLCSFITSIFNYNSLIISLFIFAVYISISKITSKEQCGNGLNK